ncbi:probable sulfite oxidase, mitochondrial [Cimex lectularius]|uniref:sulfite oxidase n=1 Tax=Cimex lectularius TaxID=79782 RepID=A0A8I6RPB4_CIMLE|nr:probable sulfite oxidase, mitochondrial [Cimex lectularius]
MNSIKSARRLLLNQKRIDPVGYVAFSGWPGQEKKAKINYNPYKYVAVGVVVGISAHLYLKSRHETLFALDIDKKYGARIEGLPKYKLSDVAKHTTKKDKIWVTFREGVYDITQFVDHHPGGDVILLAAGGSVEPFWLMYGVHKQEHILKILEQFRIGNLDPEEADEVMKNMEDPYSTDPKRHPALHPNSVKPFNAEPPPEILVGNFLTPQDLFYVRNHLPVPEINSETYELEIEGLGIQSKTFTLNELKELPKHTITATVMCAGNRRSEMSAIKPVKGLNWTHAAIGNATWSGPKLLDVLKSLGLDDNPEAQHVQFEGLDTDPTNTPYGASIPIEKVLDPRGDVILAYEMNGEPLSRDHGFPIRVVVPGIVGARNVKWLGRIILSKEESESHWQRNDYKGFSPSTDWDTVDFTKSPAIQELPVVSAICIPKNGESVKVDNNSIVVKGYAWSGGGRKIVRVDLTIDSGKTWHVANFEGQDNARHPYHWGWTLWTATIPVDNSSQNVEIWAKAVDSNYNTQPESFANTWNLRGVLGNAYHRIKIKLINNCQ